MSVLRLPVRVVPLVAAGALVLAGCGASGGASGGGSDRQAVAAFFPLAWVTAQVAGDDWEVTNLTRPGGEPHDLELGIAQTVDLEDAGLVVFESGFQPAVDDAVDTVAEGVVVDAAEAVALRSPDEQHATRGRGALGRRRPRPRGHGSALLAGPAADGRPRRRGRRQARRGSTRTVRRRTGGTPRTCAPSSRRSTRSSPPAWPTASATPSWSATRRSATSSATACTSRPIAGLSPDAEPTPAVLAELQELIAEEGITTVFSERLASPAMAESLASDTGVETAVLDPLEGPGEGDDSGDYVALMQQNLAALRGQRMLNTTGPPVVEARDVTVAIGGRPVLRGNDLVVREGEFVALMGANGSGKSTLVRALTGLRPLTQGSVLLFGTPLHGLPVPAPDRLRPAARDRDGRRAGQRARGRRLRPADPPRPAASHEPRRPGRHRRRPRGRRARPTRPATASPRCPGASSSGSSSPARSPASPSCSSSTSRPPGSTCPTSRPSPMRCAPCRGAARPSSWSPTSWVRSSRSSTGRS